MTNLDQVKAAQRTAQKTGDTEDKAEARRLQREYDMACVGGTCAATLPISVSLGKVIIDGHECQTEWGPVVVDDCNQNAKGLMAFRLLSCPPDHRQYYPGDWYLTTISSWAIESQYRVPVTTTVRYELISPESMMETGGPHRRMAPRAKMADKISLIYAPVSE